MGTERAKRPFSRYLSLSLISTSAKKNQSIAKKRTAATEENCQGEEVVAAALAGDQNQPRRPKTPASELFEELKGRQRGASTEVAANSKDL